MELAKYNIDIAALCETRFSEYGSLNDLEYSFFWSGKPEGERREAGVVFAIKKEIVTKLTEMPRPVSDRIMTMRLPLSKDNFATIISVYAPTMTNPDENKEAFYNQLASVLSGIPRTDKLLLIGDFNARKPCLTTNTLGRISRKTMWAIYRSQKRPLWRIAQACVLHPGINE